MTAENNSNVRKVLLHGSCGLDLVPIAGTNKNQDFNRCSGVLLGIPELDGGVAEAKFCLLSASQNVDTSLSPKTKLLE